MKVDLKVKHPLISKQSHIHMFYSKLEPNALRIKNIFVEYKLCHKCFEENIFANVQVVTEFDIHKRLNLIYILLKQMAAHPHYLMQQVKCS
jgi:hypothetical protein